MRIGWATSEFWLSFGAAALGAWLALGESTTADRIAGALLAGLAAVGYGTSRGLAKRNPRP